MKRILELLGEFSLVGLGLIGLFGIASMSRVVAVVLVALGGVLVALHLLSVTFVTPNQSWPISDALPRPLRIGFFDYAKATVAWILGFRRTYAVRAC